MYNRIKNIFYRVCIKIILSSRRLQSYLHSLLTREGSSLLRAVLLNHKEGSAFRRLLVTDGLEIVREELASSDSVLFAKTVECNQWSMLESQLVRDNSQKLRNLLSTIHGKALADVFEKDNSELLNRLLEADGCRLLNVVLDADNHRLLRSALSADGHQLLRSLLLANDREVFRSLCMLDDGAFLAQLLSQDLLNRLLEADGNRLLNVVLDADNHRLLRSALSADGHQLLRSLLLANDREIFGSLCMLDDGAFLGNLFRSGYERTVRRILSEENYYLLTDALLSIKNAALGGLFESGGVDWLRDIFRDQAGRLFEQVFCEGDYQILEAHLRKNKYAHLRTLLEKDEHRYFRAILESDNLTTLHRLLKEDDCFLAKAVLSLDNFSLLHDCLLADGYRLMNRFLSVNEGQHLISILSANEGALLEKAMDAQEGFLLSQILSSDGARRLLWEIERDNLRLFRLVVRSDSFRNLKKVLLENKRDLLGSLMKSNGYALLLEILDVEEGALIKNALLANELSPLKKLIVDTGLIERILSNKRLSAVVDLVRAWQRVKPVVNLGLPGIDEEFAKKSRTITNSAILHRTIGELFCKDDEAFLAKGQLRYPEFSAFWVLLNEILLSEDYFFSADTDCPKILDCGTNFGMAIYYFKQLYPNSRIVGFEPVPFLREIAIQNVARNNLSDVTILPYALAGKPGKSRFRVSKLDSMAGSLAKRDLPYSSSFEQIEVECRTLSSFLDEPVHFLKIDVEGVEDEILEEAQLQLSMVQNIFVEYHQGQGLGQDRLPRILEVLQMAGFEIAIDGTFSGHHAVTHRPITSVGNPFSLSIWGRNTEWKGMQ